MTAEKRIDNAVREEKKLDLMEFMELVHDTANTLYGIDTEITVVKEKDGWVIKDDYNDWFADGVNIRDCYEHLYIHLLEELLKEELEEEAYLEEMETRNSFDKWYGNNNGVAYGRY